MGVSSDRCININGLNDRTKRITFVSSLQCLKADIICLLETHAASHAVLRAWFKDSGNAVASSSISNKQVGTAILVRSCHELRYGVITLVVSHKSRFVWVRRAYVFHLCML